MTAVLAFLLALPLAVYLIAGVMSVIDGPNRSRALVGFTLRLGFCALFVALIPGADRIWIGTAFLTVLALHTLTTAATRYAIRSGRWPTDRID